MPQIKIRGIDSEIIRKLSKQLFDELAVLTQSPWYYSTLEVIHSSFVIRDKGTGTLSLFFFKFFKLYS